ncbi:MAG: D-alanyl-D-alanine carboxypeptidase/D-alanyl-D-alanine-endopeptidase [Planctomycetes bacterium]|nr:D-alanyl-D-alanine carboxypeptidase/D-alanyl-D-alanine-endopeptidase [Planctomycetota bacterium]
MRRGCGWLQAGLVALAGLGLAPAALRAQDTIERLVADVERDGTRVGLVALDAGGRILARHRATELFVPASNQKLLTAAAALEELGTGHEFVTRFALAKGELVVAAGGDPNWISGSDHDPARVLGVVLAALRANGVGAVRGVRVEPGPFTGPARPDGWPTDQLDRTYAAPTGAVALDAGCVRVRVTPTRTGPAQVEIVHPPAAVPIDGSIQAVPKGRRTPVFHVRDTGGVLRVSGQVQAGTRGIEASVAVADAEAWFRTAAADALRSAGIALADAAPQTDLALAEYRSPVWPAVEAALKDSSNFHAEMLLRSIGAKHGDGSFAGGIKAVQAALRTLLGGWPEGAVLADGSGLSRDNRITPGMLAILLRRAAERGYAERFRNALAVAGADGTLERRFHGSPVQGRVFAKTGYLRGVSALSGYVLQDDGRPRTFVILMNAGPNARVAALRKAQERIVEAIAAAPAEK